MTIPKLDEQVAELMRLVEKFAKYYIFNDAPHLRVAVEAFARAALVAGAHPDKDTSAHAAPEVPAPAACAETLIFEDYPEFHAEGMGCGLEDRNITDRYEAMRYGWDEALEAVGINITGFLSDLPQTAPVAQLSERPKLAFDESHIDYIDRYGGFCRDCADEDGVCPSSGLPCGGSKKAIRHVLTALAYGVNNGYLPALAAQPPQQSAQPVAWMHETPGRVDVIHDEVKKLLSAVATDYLYRPIDKSEKYTIPLYAAAQPVEVQRVPMKLEEIELNIGPDEGDREAVVAIVREVEEWHGIKHTGSESSARQTAQRGPLTVNELWENDALMALNAELGLSIQHFKEIAGVIEAAHGIKPTSSKEFTV